MRTGCVCGGGGGEGGEVVSQVPEQSAGQSEIGPVSKPTFLAVFLPFFFFFFSIALI